ncbi:hypothetical protein LXL04_023798 [Taraxacum kok-saghyz]
MVFRIDHHHHYYYPQHRTPQPPSLFSVYGLHHIPFVFDNTVITSNQKCKKYVLTNGHTLGYKKSKTSTIRLELQVKLKHQSLMIPEAGNLTTLSQSNGVTSTTMQLFLFLLRSSSLLNLIQAVLITNPRVHVRGAVTYIGKTFNCTYLVRFLIWRDFWGMILVESLRKEHGGNVFFNGYTVTTWHVVNGLLVSWLMKYADNIVKVYSTSMAMLLTMVLSVFLFTFKPTLQKKKSPSRLNHVCICFAITGKDEEKVLWC